MSWLVSWLDSFTTTAEDSVGAEDQWAGTIGVNVGGSLPEWKSNLHVSYAWGDLTVGASWRYIDSMLDANKTWDPVFKIPETNYFDLNASYEFSSGFLRGLRIGLGVENLTDEDPPIFPSHSTGQHRPVAVRRLRPPLLREPPLLLLNSKFSSELIYRE